MVKVFVHYEEGSDAELHTVLKLTLPKKWATESPVKVMELFLDTYNGRKPENKLDLADYHLETASGITLAHGDVIGECMAEKNGAFFVRKGPTLETGPFREEAAKAAAAAAEAEAEAEAEAAAVAAAAVEADRAAAAALQKKRDDQAGKVRCRNFGCNQFFDEAENSDPTACGHHTKPPIFHDTKKGWGCCEKRVYDWEEFQALPTCSRGRHSSVPPVEAPSSSPDANATAVAAALPLKSISDYNKSNPNAVTAASSAVKTVMEKPKCTRREDGTASCINKGCQKDFVVADNHATACTYHVQGPVFHDTGKYWACCPGVVKYDFEDFTNIKGCTTGYHNDGSGDHY